MRIALTGLILACLAVPATAALPVGSKAPDFTTVGAIAGKPFRLHLKDQLKHGPVVLYFFPKAFTKGCTLEARAFSEANPQFRKLGARVVGVSRDGLEELKRFSVEECRNAFPVATASAQMAKDYDVVLAQKPELTDRTSYVIAPDGRIAYVHSDLDWSGHVEKTLAAVKALKSAK
ncbi:peroxiredoxin [Sphingomonas sabuli]|uniref:thioredoxin-dependent peroxiredoxin n=1 Tax=Sphingomonas sabuli TaxID=2764186 RepID=A0A7G9L0A0_9SPHN|nr:peroxiredoxin [Sphingomonas sabuli]QNM82049.1 peroxiredoxin [Sphingomonas sabuli]